MVMVSHWMIRGDWYLMDVWRSVHLTEYSRKIWKQSKVFEFCNPNKFSKKWRQLN
jgi:hypothetical protein